MTVATRHPEHTASTLSYRMGIQDANVAGNVHGGWIMKLCDDVGAIAATRHAGGRVVTAAVDFLKFRSPVHVGNLLTLRSTVNAAWRTSMEVGVRVEAEDLVSGTRRHTNSCYMTFVAIDRNGRPIEVPEIAPETPDEERRYAAAKERRRRRLEERNAEEKALAG